VGTFSVLRYQVVGGDQLHPFGTRLGGQHPVEGVPVERREVFQGEGVVRGHCDLPVPGCDQRPPQADRIYAEVLASQTPPDDDFPEAAALKSRWFVSSSKRLRVPVESFSGSPAAQRRT